MANTSEKREHLVAQTSKSAVSPISKSARREARTVGGFGNPRHSRLGSLRYAPLKLILISITCAFTIQICRRHGKID
jgi:ribosomal protein L44E